LDIDKKKIEATVFFFYSDGALTQLNLKKKKKHLSNWTKTLLLEFG